MLLTLSSRAHLDVVSLNCVGALTFIRDLDFNIDRDFTLDMKLNIDSVGNTFDNKMVVCGFDHFIGRRSVQFSL